MVAWREGAAGSVVLKRALTAGERGALERRASDLRGAVAAWPEARRDALLAAISGMLGAFAPMARYDAQTARLIASGYLWTARAQPAWAVVRACDLIRAGKAGLNREFAPSEASFLSVVEAEVEPYRMRLRTAEAVLAASVVVTVTVRPTLDELRARYGPNWGMRGGREAEADALRKAAREAAASASDRMIAAERAAHGAADDGDAASPALRRALARRTEGEAG